MEINAIPFRETEFLLGLLAHLESKFGSEKRFILEHKFSCIDKELARLFPSLQPHIDNVLIKKYLSEWFREAEVRELLCKVDDQHFKITNSGILAAYKARSPYKHFAKEHWKFLLGTSLAFISSIIAIIRLIKC